MIVFNHLTISREKEFMNKRINDHAMDLLFREPRSHNKWLPKPVSEDQLKELYDLMKWGPTCANCFPMRIVFVTEQREKEKLATTAYGNNQEKILAAPVTAILAHDLDFYEWLPRLIPPKPEYQDMYGNNEKLAYDTAFRNSSLQGAYFMLAARGLGLDCGPQSGFNNEAVDEMFFPETNIKTNFLCGIGHGDLSGVWPRLPRPEFEEVCTIL
jgi:3-hydroxypropanoate dehydrogenase